MPGYSGTPLAKKLGLREGSEVLLLGAPTTFVELLEPLPPCIRFAESVSPATDLIHLFITERAVLEARLAMLLAQIRPDAAVWVSWPKKAAKVPTDLTEDRIREVALTLGFVDIKVCAVDETWSGLKLVIRKELRP